VTYLLVAFLVVLVVPLLTASWRLSLIGLGLQGLLMAAMVAERGWTPSAGGVLLLLDLLLLRTWFVPRHLFAIMRRLGGPGRRDVIPANLLSWTMAGALVLVGFRFADLVRPGAGGGSTLVAVATSGLLLGLLVLATQASTFGQVIGVLRVEYAIDLFELGAGHEPALPVQLGVAAVLLLSVLTLGGFLRRLGAAGPDHAAARGQADHEERAA
jgi:hydrogenase-4 membrane subunit HyfE